MVLEKSRFLRHLFGRKSILAGIFIIACFIFLHSCMQFRTSDKKTYEYFKKNNVEVSLSYLSVPSYNQPIRLIATGNNKNTAVIFVHGAPGSADAFYGYLSDSLLVKRAELYTYDRPGYGYSGFGDAVVSIEKQAKILSEIIESNRLHRVVLVGHSYGGPIAAYTALLNSRVTGVVMVAPAIDPDLEKYYWVGNFARWNLTKWAVPTSWKVSADEKYSHEANLRNLNDEWKKISVPVIHIHGKKDKIVPFQNLDYSKKHFHPLFFTSSEYSLENHFILWKNRSLVTKEIYRLLDGHEKN